MIGTLPRPSWPATGRGGEGGCRWWERGGGPEQPVPRLAPPAGLSLLPSGATWAGSTWALRDHQADVGAKGLH